MVDGFFICRQRFYSLWQSLHVGVLCLFLFCLCSHALAQKISFIALSHTEKLNAHPEHVERLLQFLEDEKTDFVLHLSNGGLEEHRIYDQYKAHFGNRFYAFQSSQAASKNKNPKPVSSLPSHLLTPTHEFVFLNPRLTGAQVAEYWENFRQQRQSNLPVVLVSSHAFWRHPEENKLTAQIFFSSSPQIELAVGVEAQDLLKGEGLLIPPSFGISQINSTELVHLIPHSSEQSVGYLVVRQKKEGWEMKPRKIYFTPPQASFDLQEPAHQASSSLAGQIKKGLVRLVLHLPFWVGLVCGILAMQIVSQKRNPSHEETHEL